MAPEVLIYIQSIKNYFENNKETKDYFIGQSDEELFFEHLSEISQKNYEKDNEPMLSKMQFEYLRKVLSAIQISKKEYTQEELLFIDVPNYGKFCLN
jgi:hypothetical protein